MKIFTGFEAPEKQTLKSTPKSGVKKASSALPPQKLSESEVRAKIEQNRATENATTSQIKKRLDVRKLESEETSVIGDVGKNDPTDSMTQQKLKSMLQANAFNFSQKEREALADILK
jgi:hypothetical protein